ncbi:MAG: T9SS type A sorting domain-containing protein [Paramuribaculum sp.]|nr:T9SS type A sorting domain-containing protein [Paramuribaculum sp.]
MKKELLAALTTITAAFGMQAATATAFRSIEVANADGSSVVINMADDMRVKFSADSMFVVSQSCSMNFGLADVKGWNYSTKYQAPPSPQEPDPEVYDPEGDGSWQAPYNSSAMRLSEDTDSVWVTGYIVGTYSGSDISTAIFGESAHAASNVLLAPSPEANHHSQCIAVQLPVVPSSYVRDALNLKDHPDNLGREVSVKGVPGELGGVRGLRSPRHYQWGPVGYDTNPGTGINTPAGDAPAFSNNGGSLSFSNLPAGSHIALYTASGMLVMQHTAEGDAVVELDGLASGVYILNVNGKSVKISVK